MSSPWRVREEVRQIVDPCSAAIGLNLDLVEMGMVKSIEVSNGSANIELRLMTSECHIVPYFKKYREAG